MDGGVSGSTPPFNFQRWRRQFAVAHLNDVARSWQNAGNGPDETLAAMRAAPASNVAGDPTGLEGVFHPRALPGGPALASELVDIYFSAGPTETFDPAYTSKGCNGNQLGNCSIWWIRWNFGTASAEWVRKLVLGGDTSTCSGGEGMVQPAVSPDGTRLAWAQKCQESGKQEAVTARLNSRDMTSGRHQWIASSNPDGEDDPQYPTWITNDALLFNTSQNNEATAWFAGYYPTFAAVGPVMGPDAAIHKDKGYEDIEAMQSPGYKTMIGGRIVSFGGGLGPPVQHIPRVTDLLGGSEEEFILPSGVTECHHPSWNPDGTAILCTREEGGEFGVSDYGPGAARRLIQFGWSSASKWEYTSTLVDALPAADINSISAPAVNVFPPYVKGSATCRNYTWKFAQWCGREDYLVATLFCTDAQYENDQVLKNTVLASRVVLIRLNGGVASAASDYVDLVTLVELDDDPSGGLLGTYNGVFSTCKSVMVG